MSQSGLMAGGDEDFATLWEAYGDAYSYATPSRGDLREGVVLQTRPDQVVIDIGAKQEALVSTRELQAMSPEDLGTLQPGAPVYVYILQPPSGDRAPIVSLERARAYQDWLRADELLASGEVVTLKVTGCNKGGAVCDFGRLQGFIPASQISSLPPRATSDAHLDRLTQMVGVELPLKVIEVDRHRRRLILSERLAIREWRAQQRDKLLAEMHEGQVCTGTVSNLCDFGAFVDVGGMDGLVHVSEIAWQRIAHPSQVLQIGQSVQVQVLRVDREGQRIGLSIKRTQPDPWLAVEDRFHIEDTVSGVVTHLVRFGAFVELEPGIEGLVHLSELGEGEVQSPAEVVAEGQAVRVMILSIDIARHQMGLSIRRASGEQALARA
ncbi:MAG: 30S ribosomal protein S1 [Chloroflexi bacterium]|jgi:small subunit ribosomal protein S1|nr:30S ribosomal protein S1 [Chloroflexota bacterium]